MPRVIWEKWEKGANFIWESKGRLCWL